MANTATSRINKDLKEVNSVTEIDTPPIFCKTVGDSLDHVEALIIGPPETPYEFGFFRFDMKFGPTYPDEPPKVLITTTDYGKTRLNPNLYAGGKVCLSILGTWTGESADEWRSTYSIHYILRAIQSLIMTQKPYHNEPGYEECNPEHGKPEEIVAYSDKIKHEVLRIAVCGAVEDAIAPKRDNAFKDLIKHYFTLYYDTYMQQAMSEVKRDGQEFMAMPFEYPENGAYGKFNYNSIIQRLQDCKGKIDKETLIWKERGHELTKGETGWKYFRMLEENETIKKGKIKLDGISAGPVTEDNLFLWNASIFGPDNTLWEGGIYNLELVFNETDAPPRVRFTSEMWHPHITKDGIPFYNLPPGTKDPVIPILLAVQKILRSEPNSSSASWVNLDAAKQYFSKRDEDKKEYRRKVATCVRKSVEG